MIDVIAERGMACDRGCFECGPSGQRLRHNGTGCCGSTICSPPRWAEQVERWLSIEEKFNYALWVEVEKATQEAWCAAEEAFREELQNKPKVYVRQEPRPPNNPSRVREIARAERVRAAQSK